MNTAEGKRLTQERKKCSAHEFCEATERVLKLGDALETGHLSDVHFLLGETQAPIKAHKLLLSLGSKVFHAMFYGGLKESDSDAIPIPDIEPKAFSLLLKFMYTEEISIKGLPIDILTSLFYAARKYDVEKLEIVLVKSFEEFVNEETAIPYLQLALFYDLKTLEKKCFECIDINADRIVFSDHFIECERDMIIIILRRDSLIISEIKLFNAVLRWAALNCDKKGISPSEINNLRNALGEALYLIRYSTMQVKDFANGPAISGVLNDTEVANVFMSFFSVHPAKQPFSSVKRMSPWRSNVHCNCIGFHCNFCDKIFPASAEKHPYWRELQVARSSTNNIPSPPSSSRFPSTVSVNKSPPPRPSRYCSCRTKGYCPEKHGYVR